MAQVVVLDSINEDIFVCGNCKLVFNSLQIFLDHKKLKCGVDLCRTNEPAVNESSCENTVTTLSHNTESHLSVSENLGIPSGIGSNECKLCKKPFKKIKSLLAHLKTHSDRPYQCPICGRCFIQNSHLQRHIASHKIWPDGLTETTPKSAEAELLSYSCAYCDIILPNYSQFRLHLKKHLCNKKFKCIQSNCSGLFVNIDDLLEHVNSSHETTIYHCHMCNQTFNTLEDIAAHQKTHLEPEKALHNPVTARHKCAQCDAVFKNPEKLSLHLLTENHNKVCIHCNRTFASDKRLRLHLQIHRKNKPFQCNICDSSFHMKKYLSSHMLKHGDKQFACSICNHKFKRKDLLQRHMKSHQAKKLFKCPFRDTLDCMKEFTRSDKLKAHVKFHTKRLVASPSPQQPVYENAGTVEICIVPLDGSIITK